MSQDDQIFFRRIKWLAKEYLYLKRYRPFLTAGRKAFLIGLAKSGLSLNWRWWRWECRWRWMQNYSWKKYCDDHAGTDCHLSYRWKINNQLVDKIYRELRLMGVYIGLIDRSRPFRKHNIFEITTEYQTWFDGAESGLVSIVLPVYNQTVFLAEALESIKRQTYTNWELIIVDDGSEEDVTTVLQPFYQDHRVRVYHRLHAGLPAALTFGFKKARGEFFSWTSADNLIEPDHLRGQVGFLQKNLDIHYVYSDYKLIDMRGEVMRHHTLESDQNLTLLPPNIVHLNSDPGNLNFSVHYTGASFMYRSIAGKIVGDHNGPLGIEDYDFDMRMNSLFSLAYLNRPEVTYCYRIHGNSLTGQYSINGFLSQRVQALHQWEEKTRQPIYKSDYCFWRVDLGEFPQIDQERVHLIVLDAYTWSDSPDQNYQLEQWRDNPRVVTVLWLSKENFIEPPLPLIGLTDWMLTDSHELMNRNRDKVDSLLSCPRDAWHSPLMKVLTYGTVVSKLRQTSAHE